MPHKLGGIVNDFSATTIAQTASVACPKHTGLIALTEGVARELYVFLIDFFIISVVALGGRDDRAVGFQNANVGAFAALA